MGIHGLTSFIQRYHEKHKEKIYLHNTVVVIDGCNLMFFLYFDWRQDRPTGSSSTRISGSPIAKPSRIKQPHLFGGDYISYAQNVREFFQHLKLCEITPIVIFDGAYESYKIRTAYKRFAENVKENVRNGLKGVTPGKSYAPVFMKGVFVEVLQEQKILNFQTEREADPTIAFVARKLGNCPILSSDSDFHIYINAVVLPLNSLRFRKVAPFKDKKLQGSVTEKPSMDKMWTLHSQYVSLPSLCRREFNLTDTRLLPLAALILGNDLIRTATFSRFHSSTAGGRKVKRNARIAYLLKWLGKQKSYAKVVRSMFATIRESERSKTQELVKEITAIYEGLGGEDKVWEMIGKSEAIKQFIVEEHASGELEISIGDMLANLSVSEESKGDGVSFNLDDDVSESVSEEDSSFAEEEDSDYDDEQLALTDNGCEGMTFPEWFLNNHRTCYLPSYILKLAVNKTVFLSPQAEISILPSTHTSSIPIIQVTAGILLGDGKQITLLSRQKSRISDVKVNTVTRLKDYGSLPVINADCLDIKKSLSFEARAQIILETLGIYTPELVNFITSWPISLRIWIICTLYYLKSLKNEDETLHNIGSVAVPVAISLMLSYMKNAILNPSGPTSRTSAAQQIPKISDILNQTDITSLAKLKLFYTKYEATVDTSSRTFIRTYDISRTYNISKFTCILFHLHQLNRLLGEPFKSPRINCSLNNWFIFNLSGRLGSVWIDKGDDIVPHLQDIVAVDHIVSLLAQVLKHGLE